MSAELEAALRAGLDDLALDLAESQVQQLLDYQTLIQKWNKVYNLTALRDPREMLTHHLLDSLAVVAPLRRHAAGATAAGAARSALRVLDVGSGAGLPGVVLAICDPAYTVDCVDTVGKKAAFIQQAAASLRLPRLRGLHARVEQLGDTYDLIASRAFASLSDFVSLSAHLLGQQGAWMAMKGRRPDDEIAALPQQVTVFHVEPLQVPGLQAERCLVWMKKHGVLT